MPDSKTDQALVKQLKDRLGKRRWLMERPWWGNILYHLGQQWVTYDQSARRWRQQKLSPSVPTPVTNLFRSTIDTIKSAIAQHTPRFIGTPTRDDPKAVAAAGSVDSHLKVILKEGRFRTSRRRMLDWLLLTGNAFIEVGWDSSEDTGLEPVPKEQCSACLEEYMPDALDAEDPKCKKCGGMLFQEMSDTYVWMPKGQIRFDALSPFEVWLDPAIEELEDQPYIIVIQSFTPEQIWMRWHKKLKDETTIQNEISAMHRDNVQNIAMGNLGSPWGYAGGTEEKRVVVYRTFIKYHPDYPKGAYIAMTAAGEVLEKQTPLPWRKENGKGKAFYPLIHYRFGTVGGRAWGYTPADDLLPKQYQLNKAESLMTLIMTRTANPVWLIPSNTNPTRITGEIGIQIEYTPVGQAAPTRVAGAEAPQSLVKYIEDIRSSFDELSGAFSAVRGRSMGTRTPVGTVQTLQDRGFGRWATVFEMLEEGYEEMAIKALELWRQNAHTPRVMAVANALGGYTFGELQGADWDDGVDVTVEAGSSRPHTQQEKLMMYVELGQMGILDFTDENQKLKMLEDLGLVNMKPGVEEDSKAAYRENSEFMQWAMKFFQDVLEIGAGPEIETLITERMGLMPVQIMPVADDHAVHFLTHRRLCLTDDFKKLPEYIKEVFFMHMIEHQKMLPLSKLNMQLSMAMNAAPGQGKPGTGPGGGSPQNAPEKEMQGGESNPDGNK